MSDAFMRRYGYVNPKKLPKFTYTGASVTTTDANGWMILLKTSGTLTFGTKLPKGIDVFLVGGGQGGTNNHGFRGGHGGGSGYTTTGKGYKAKKGTGYSIVIGAGSAGGAAAPDHWNWPAAGGTSSAFGYSAAGGGAAYGQGGSGGANPPYDWGGGAQNGTKGGSNGGNGGTPYGEAPTDAERGQGSTTRAFGDSTGWLFAAGGGSGPLFGGNGGAGGDGEYISLLGINTKGGDGGVGGADNRDGGSAAANSGSGGGGAGGVHLNSGGVDRKGGNGGSGIVIIRNAR